MFGAIVRAAKDLRNVAVRDLIEPGQQLLPAQWPRADAHKVKSQDEQDKTSFDSGWGEREDAIVRV